jgi:nicotinate-nucleotide adenylyltransferase
MNTNTDENRKILEQSIVFAKKLYPYFDVANIDNIDNMEMFYKDTFVVFNFNIGKNRLNLNIYDTYTNITITQDGEKVYVKQVSNNSIGIVEIINTFKIFNAGKFTFKDNVILANGCNVAMFSGSFNPPTKAHHHVIKKIIDSNKFDFVFISICNKKFLEKKQRKADKICYTEDQRLKFMLQMTISMPNVLIYGIEDGYTIDVLENITKTYINSQAYFVCGSDKIEEIKRWHRNEELRNNYGIIIITRNDDNEEQINVIAKENFKKYQIVKITKYLDLSATYVRNQISNNGDLTNIVSDEIIELVKKEKPYQIFTN